MSNQQPPFFSIPGTPGGGGPTQITAPQYTSPGGSANPQYGSTPQQNAANQLGTNGLPQLPGAISGQQGNGFSPYLLNPNSLQQIRATTYQTPNIGSPAQYGGTQLGQTSTLDPKMIEALTAGNTPNLTANDTITQLLQAFAPQQRQAQAGLNDQLAAAGLSGGPAVAAQNNLNSQLTQALAPTLAGAIQQSQSNQLNAGQFNTTQLLNSLGANMNALNTTNQNQGQLNQQAGLANQSAVNANQQLFAQLGQQTGLANMDAINTAATTNAGAANALNASNVSQQNQSQQQYLSALLQQYQDQFSAFNSINDAGLNTQNNIAASGANNFQTPGADPFSGLAGSFGSLYAPAARTAAAIPA